MRITPRPNGKFLTPRLAEVEYGIPYAKIYLWCTGGKLPTLSRAVAGRTVMFKRTDFENFLESNMTTEVEI